MSFCGVPATTDPLLQSIALNDDAAAALSQRSGGDARRALNALELAASWVTDGCIDADTALRAMGERTVSWDRGGDAHYTHASALIKSIRSSHVDASLHWLAVKLEGGEDPMFICRRLAIAASEDVGLGLPAGHAAGGGHVADRAAHRPAGSRVSVG